MIAAFFHKKEDENKAIKLQLCECHPFLVQKGSLLDIVSLSKKAEYDGSFSVRGEEILANDPVVSLLSADGVTYDVIRSQKESIPGNTANIVSRTERFVQSFCLDREWNSYLQRLSVLIAQEIYGNPAYVYLDVSKTRNVTNRDILVSFVQFVFPDEMVFLYAPDVKNASKMPLLSEDGVFVEKPFVDEAFLELISKPKAFNTFFEDLCFSQNNNSESSSKKEQEVSSAKPAFFLKLFKNRDAFHNKEKSKKPGLAAPSRKNEKKRLSSDTRKKAPFRELLLNFVKSQGSNFGFALAFLVLAIVTPIVFFNFSNESKKDAFFFVCVSMTVLFVVMSAVPIGFLHNDYRLNRYTHLVSTILVTIALPLLAELGGLLLVLLSNQKGWESSLSIFFFVPFFVAPLIFAAYLTICYFLEKKQKNHQGE